MKSENKIYIFVEGKSDREFLSQYLKFLNIDVEEQKNIVICGGKDRLKEKKDEIKKILNQGSKVAIIFDADNDYKKSLENIKNQICSENDISIFLLPNNKDTGNLETLIEKIATKKEIIHCFNCYLECIKKHVSNLNLKNLKKSTIYAYLEAIGEKNKAGSYDKIDFENLNFFDLECEYLKPLKEFLENCVK